MLRGHTFPKRQTVDRSVLRQATKNIALSLRLLEILNLVKD